MCPSCLSAGVVRSPARRLTQRPRAHQLRPSPLEPRWAGASLEERAAKASQASTDCAHRNRTHLGGVQCKAEGVTSSTEGHPTCPDAGAQPIVRSNTHMSTDWLRWFGRSFPMIRIVGEIIYRYHSLHRLGEKVDGDLGRREQARRAEEGCLLYTSPSPRD